MQKLLPNNDISEDCLLLNIYVPGHNLQPANTYPVMVWIHGGAFNIGQGMLYESTALAGLHDVIVVTINYRLGTFGFLSTGDEYCPGNFGLHDQIMSLQWVQENIANFGGDPTQVTIFGESSGGACTSILSHSPAAVDLFHRVISQSGVYHRGLMISTERATQFAYNVGYTANCNTTDNPDLTDHYLLIECLRDLTWEQLLYAQSESIIVPFPVVDGDIIPGIEPKPATDKFKEYDYLAGTNSWEASLLVANVDQFDDGKMNDVIFRAMIRVAVQVIFENNEHLISDASYHKYTAWYQTDDDEVRLDRFKNFFNELAFLAPTVAQLREHSRRTLIPPSPPETNTYHYYFDHRPSFYTGPDYIDGAAHATEIPFTFGLLMMTGIGPFGNMTAPADEKLLSLDMSRYWTNFAKSGDPNQPVAVPVQWPLYDNTLYTYMRFEPNMSANNVRENLRADGTAFWIEYVPTLVNLTCPSTTPPECASPTPHDSAPITDSVAMVTTSNFPICILTLIVLFISC
ncbi:neuroligin-4, X-linked-like [Saccoglossus kowalevskii]